MEKGLKSLNVGSESVLIYANSANRNLNPVFREASDKRKKLGYWKGFWNSAERPTMQYELLGVKPSHGQWKWSEDKAKEAVKNYEEYLQKYSDDMSLEDYWEKTGKDKKFIKRNLKGKGVNQGIEHWIPPSEGILRNSSWTDILASENLNDYEIYFDTLKSQKMMDNLIKLSGGKIILDFFAGSGSTAHAVINYNKDN